MRPKGMKIPTKPVMPAGHVYYKEEMIVAAYIHNAMRPPKRKGPIPSKSY